MGLRDSVSAISFSSRLQPPSAETQRWNVVERVLNMFPHPGIIG